MEQWKRRAVSLAVDVAVKQGTDKRKTERGKDSDGGGSFVDLYPSQPLWAISGSFEVRCGLADVIKTNYAYGTVIPHHFMP